MKARYLLVAVVVPLVLSRIWQSTPAWLCVFSGALVAYALGAALRVPGRTAPAIAAFAAGFLTWIFGYGLVVFDNPSPNPITFSVDGAVSLPLAGWKHEKRYFPVGNHTFEAAGVRFSGHVDGVGKHLATPSSATCYALFERVYGALSGADLHGDERLRGQSFYTMKYVSYYFEEPPRSVSTSGCESGRAERKLDRSQCTN